MDRDEDSVVTGVDIRDAGSLGQGNIVVSVPGKNDFDSPVRSEYPRQSYGDIKSVGLFREKLTRHTTSIESAVSRINHHNGRTRFDVRRNQQDKKNNR